MKGIFTFLIFWLFLFHSAHANDINKPPAAKRISTYLTFQTESTATSITVNIYAERNISAAKIFYGQASTGGKRDLYPLSQEAHVEYISKANRSVASFQLNNLKPNTTYYFSAGNEDMGFDKEFKFRTLPNGDSPIRIVQGGDMGTSDLIPKTIENSLNSEPHAILIGGDIAYVNADIEKTRKWDNWFEQMNHSMTTAKGFLIPMILAIGNHETNPFSFSNRVVFFYKLFPQNGTRSYFKRYLGNHTVIYVLDTGHDTPHFGKQAEWLKSQFKADAQVVNKVALYHIPLYPSNRSYYSPQSILGRESWLRYFDRYHLKLAFENHDHTLKRTHLLKDGKVVKENGVLYLGDGCWGKNSREAERRWYLKSSLEQTHVWNVTLAPNLISGHAEGEKGRVYDQFQLKTSLDGSQLIEE